MKKPFRESFARIIDPKNWKRFDNYKIGVYADHITYDQRVAWTLELQPSLKKAEEILSMIQTNEEKPRLTQREKSWLIGVLDREKLTSHCGEGTFERQHRENYNDKVDHVISVILSDLKV